MLNKKKGELRKEEERRIRELREEKEGKERAYKELMDGVGEEGAGAGAGRSNAEGWDEDDFM